MFWLLYMQQANSGFQTSLKKGGKQSKREKGKVSAKTKEKDKHQSQSQEPYKAISAFFKTPLSSPSLDNGIVSD